MKDLIERQAAIDALCRWCDLAAEDDEPCTEKCNDIKMLELLPSVEVFEIGKTYPLDGYEFEIKKSECGNAFVTIKRPTVDCISSTQLSYTDEQIQKMQELEQAEIEKAYELGRQEAQPEIIRCKDCEWWEKQKDSLQGRCALMQMYPTGEWYCGNAQRRVSSEEADIS